MEPDKPKIQKSLPAKKPLIAGMIKTVLSTLFIVFLLFLLLEILCRVGLFAYIHFKYVPRLHSDSEAAVRHDKTLGWIPKGENRFRGKADVSEKKAPDAYRIIVLGGSAARGAGVQADQTFSWLLEENLSKANPPLKPEVLNAGVNGYHLIQMADYLEIYLLLYHPDLVIAYSGAFDASDQAIDPGKPIEAFDVRKERQPSTSLKIVDEIRKLLDSLESYYLLTRLVLPLRDRAPDVITDSSTLKDKRSAGLMRIRLLCEMIGAEFMIAEPVTRPNGKDTLAVPGWNRDREWEGYFTPLYEPFLQSGFAPSELFFDEVHLSKQGHKFVAQELTRSILGLNLIEREYEDRKNSD